MSRFTHFLEIFLFGSKTVFLGQEVHYYMVYIAYFTELNLQICDYEQKRRIYRENCKYALDERFHGHFCLRRKPAKSCHPAEVSDLCMYFVCGKDTPVLLLVTRSPTILQVGAPSPMTVTMTRSPTILLLCSLELHLFCINKYNRTKN